MFLDVSVQIVLSMFLSSLKLNCFCFIFIFVVFLWYKLHHLLTSNLVPGCVCGPLVRKYKLSILELYIFLFTCCQIFQPRSLIFALITTSLFFRNSSSVRMMLFSVTSTFSTFLLRLSVAKNHSDSRSCAKYFQGAATVKNEVHMLCS